jgi:hypothetical protein
MRELGVTSKEGFQAGMPSGAILLPNIEVSSTSGLIAQKRESEREQK